MSFTYLPEKRDLREYIRKCGDSRGDSVLRPYHLPINHTIGKPFTGLFYCIIPTVYRIFTRLTPFTFARVLKRAKIGNFTYRRIRFFPLSTAPLFTSFSVRFHRLWFHSLNFRIPHAWIARHPSLSLFKFEVAIAAACWLARPHIFQ